MSRIVYELTHCPVCDSLDGDEIADQDAMRSEVELLWAFHEKRLKVGVPPEYLTDRLAFSQHPPIRLSRCRQCDHIYRNPWERREALNATYAGTHDDESVLQSLFATQCRAARPQARRLVSVAGPGGSGLEVGSYVGSFLAAAKEVGWSFEGVDVNADASNFAVRNGFRVTRGEITDLDAQRSFDAIAIWNTFEQLYDVRAALVAARRLLHDGGILALRTPNGGFYADWRKRLGGPLSGIALRLLAHNNLLSFPYRQGFTQRSLAVLLDKCGFAILKTVGDTLVPIADRWTTTFGAVEERWVKGVERLLQRGWQSPWVEVYARATEGA